jgi:AraC-like DNA-binding protein
MSDIPPWLDEGWLRHCLRRGVGADLAKTDGHLDLLSDWDTGDQRLDQWLLYRIDTGTIQVSAEFVEYRCGSGGLILIPAATAFRSRCASPDGCRIARCRLDLPPARGLLCTQLGAGVLLGEIVELAARPAAPLQPQRIAGLLVATLSALLEPAADHRQRLDRQQRHLLEAWCAEHVRHRIEAADIAALLGLSLDYCTRLFRNTYGCAPRTWLLRERLRHVAVALRESHATLDDIARSFGYIDQNLMGRQFTRAYGTSPGRYRRG